MYVERPVMKKTFKKGTLSYNYFIGKIFMAEPVRNGYARQDLMNKSYPTRFEGENDYLGGTYEKNACGTGNCSSNGVFTLTTVSASTLMFTYSGAINKALNINTSKIVETDDASAVNTAYYDNEFGTDYTNKQAALKVEMEVAAENVAQAERVRFCFATKTQPCRLPTQAV